VPFVFLLALIEVVSSFGTIETKSRKMDNR